MPRSRVLLATLLLLLPLPSPAADAPPASGRAASARTAPGDAQRLSAVLARLIGEETASGGAYAKLAYLSDRIGPRLSGSEQAEAAVQWALAEFRRDGQEAIRAEKVMVPHWVRGEEKADLVAPASHPLAVTALGMSVPTPAGGITAEVVEVASFEELRALGEAVRGKMVLYNKPIPPEPDGNGYGSAADLRYHGAVEAARQGASAMLIRSLGTVSARLPHTGGQAYDDAVPRIPAAAISAEDAEMIHRLRRDGPVRVRLTLGCRTLPDAESANVVAELRGSRRPEEIVVIGGHLDSWDLGTGAIDDGAGVAVSMEALRLLRKLNLRPRRTIRAVLFMNEENGGRGGKEYARAHRSEMDRHVAAIESDSGAGAPLGFSVTAGEGGEAVVRELSARLAGIGATRVTPDGGGVDVGRMKEFGVPLLGLRQDMTRYFDWHHSAADTLDKVDPRELADNAVAMAFMAYALADRPEPLPRIDPKDRAKE